MRHKCLATITGSRAGIIKSKRGSIQKDLYLEQGLEEISARVKYDFERFCRLIPEKPIVLGVSGGPDSICMLDIMQKWEYPLVVAHLDHQIRPSSAREAEEVRRQVIRRGLPFYGAVEDVIGHAAGHNLSLEEAARKLRYRFLFETARMLHAQAVAVGHTADDQVETVLMHLLQGTGLRGLRGISRRTIINSFSREIPLVRPLLSIWRSEILAYCEANGLPTIHDPSNQDPAFTRNRIRQTLIPMLETFNPRARAALWRMAEILSGELEVNRVAVGRVWEQAVEIKGPDRLLIPRATWEELGPGFQRAILRRAMESLDPSGRSSGYQGVENGVAFISLPGETRREKSLGAIRLVCEGGEVWVLGPEALVPVDDFPNVEKGFQHPIEVPGLIELPGGWQLRAEPVGDIREAYRQARENRDLYQAWVDLKEVGGRDLGLRARQEGDRLKPLGMDGSSQKLSDFMINVKIPVRARAQWPLVVVENELVWIPGYRLGHPFRLTKRTEAAIFLRLEKTGRRQSQEGE